MKLKALCTFLLGCSLNVTAANIVPFINSSGGLNLDISGEILEGDDINLREIIAAAKSNTLAIDYISLNSMGGDTETAVRMSYGIHSVGANTIVTDRSICSDTCFLLFAAGAKRILLPKAKVSARKISLEETESYSLPNPITISDLYRFYELPKKAVETLDNIPPSKAYWFTKEDKKSFDTKKDVDYGMVGIFRPTRLGAKGNTGFTNYLNGLCYYLGLGVEQDYSKAFDFFALAADDNVPEALHKLGVMYYTGRYVDKDLELAEELWTRSASEGYYPSLNNISLVFDRATPSENIEINEKILSSNEADRASRAYASLTLGDSYSEGMGIVVSKDKALSYYKLSAQLGDSLGQYHYGTMLSDRGEKLEAALWFNTACSVGEMNSCRILRR